MKLTKAAFVAAAFLSAAQASAASVWYSFATTGIGTQTAGPNSVDRFTPETVRDLVFTYAISDGQSLTRQDTGELTFPLAPGGGTARLNGISFSLDSANRQTGSISACFDNPAAIFPGAGQTIATTCGGTVNFQAFNFQYGALLYSGTVTSVSTLTSAGTSSTGLVSVTSLVPEPTTWALMLAGFGMVGYVLRRRRSQIVYA